jgi:glycosyltransferase involved in cell wall biosynthesis
MNILIVHNSYQQRGGEDTVFAQECDLLRDAGHHVIAYQQSNDDIGADSVSGKVSAFSRSVWSRDSYQDVASILERDRPDIVHVHNTHMMISPSIFYACRRYRVPVIQTLHNYRLFCPASNFYRDGKVCEECVSHSLLRSVRYGCYRSSRIASAAVASTLAIHRTLRTWTRLVHTFIALAPFAREKFIAAGLPAQKIVIKPNFAPDLGRREGSGDYVVFVGRLTPEKGVRTLIRAAALADRSIPIRIVGDGPIRAELEAEVAALGLENVTFLGLRPRTETINIIKQARFMVFPSEWYEGFAMTIVEAMACGVPIIASRIGVVRDIVTDGRTGLLFEPGNPSSLAQALMHAWNRIHLTSAMGHNARREFELKYTAKQNLKQLTAIYEAALARPLSLQTAVLSPGVQI